MLTGREAPQVGEQKHWILNHICSYTLWEEPIHEAFIYLLEFDLLIKNQIHQKTFEEMLSCWVLQEKINTSDFSAAAQHNEGKPLILQLTDRLTPHQIYTMITCAVPLMATWGRFQKRVRRWLFALMMAWLVVAATVPGVFFYTPRTSWTSTHVAPFRPVLGSRRPLLGSCCGAF